MVKDADGVFRAQMRSLARRGGISTKRRFQGDPLYYQQIGRLGGIASAISRRNRIADNLREAEPGGDNLGCEPSPCPQEKGSSQSEAPDAVRPNQSLVKSLEGLIAALEEPPKQGSLPSEPNRPQQAAK